MTCAAAALWALAAWASGAAAAPASKPASPGKPAAAAAKAPEPPRDVTIAADSMEVLPDAKKAIWRGHVKVDRADMQITCDSMVADYGDDKKLTILTCKGHAHLWQSADPPRHPEREAWGDLAVFDNRTGVLTLTGSPHGREGDNKLRGEKITYLSRENRTLVEKVVIEAQEQPASASPGPRAGREGPR